MVTWTALVALVAALLSITSHASFIAIDYGSEWTKASLMSPGRKIDVLLNTDSKRKIQSVVGWNKQDRLFGTDAFNIAARFPEDSFPSLKFLTGSRCGNHVSQYYSSITQAKPIKNGRDTCSLRRPDGTEWSVEELIAMQFAYIKDLAEKESKEKITEAVVTVPPFYTQFERQAVLDALDIAGLRPIGLINDGMAVAINYATGTTFDHKETHVIYDAGASSITATVVSFYNSPQPDATKVLKSSLKNATHVEVHSFGFDVVASGTELDRRLRDKLIRMFEAKFPVESKGIRQNGRAMSRLWKEAQRVKAILSANTESAVRVESLVGEVDFKDQITRAQFEALASDLTYAQPIHEALSKAKLTMDDIKSVILTGGASRIPMVLAAVKEVVGDKIARNVNSDEAAVLGAAFYGATTKTTWRTKPMKFQDVSGIDVQVKFTKEGSDKVVTPLVLPERSKFGMQHAKRLTFPKRSQDFTVIVGYKRESTPDFPSLLFEAKIGGVTEAFLNLTGEGVTTPQIKAAFGLTDSGLVTIEDAVATGEVKRQSIADKVKDFLKDAAGDSTTDSAESSTAPAATPSTEPDVATAPEVLSHPLSLEVIPMSIIPLTDEEKIKSQARLAAILDAERAKVRRAEAMNHLEGYLYRLRDLLDAESTEPFKQFVQPQEEEQLRQGLEEAMRWMDDEADEADAATLWKKRNDLEAIERPVIARYKEASTGPKALSDLQKAHALARMFLKEAQANRTEALAANLPPRFTEDDLKGIDDLVSASEQWLGEMTEKQKPLTKREDPVLKTADMEERGIAIQRLVKGLERRKPYRPPKPTTSSSTATTTGTETAGQSTSTTSGGGHSREEL